MMLPILIFIFKYSLPVAIGTTITAVILTALSGAVRHIRLRNVDYTTVKIVAASGSSSALHSYTVRLGWYTKGL